MVWGPGLVARVAAAPSPDARLAALADEYLGGWLERHPHLATRLGLHDRDGALRPLTEASVGEDLEWIAGLRARLDTLPRDRMSFGRALDRDFLAARLARDSLDLAVIQPFRSDPSAYLDLVAGSIESVLERGCGSTCARARAAARRLSQVPEVLRAAKLNLRAPCAPLVALAIPRFRGVLAFYRETLPALTHDCREPRQQADLAEADSVAVAAVEDFLDYLGADLPSRPADSLALGSDGLRRLLFAEEMDTTSVETLLARASAALDSCRRQLDAAALRVAPAGGLEAALDSLALDRAGPRDLIPRVRAALARTRTFLTRRRSTTFLLLDGLEVRAMPADRRGFAPLSLDAPGPWDNCVLASFLEVQPFDSLATASTRSERSIRASTSACELAVIREGWPGRCLRLATARRAPSRLRQAFASPGNVEGWAGYSEQIAIEQGYGRESPRVEMVHLLSSLASLGRLVTALSFHSGRMTLDEATRLLQSRCALAPSDAAREALRAAAEPASWLGALGQWRILELRDEVRRRLGPRFRLEDFDDAFLDQGCSPLPIVRQAVLRGLEAPPGRR